MYEQLTVVGGSAKDKNVIQIAVNTSVRKAMVLAAGEGTRLRPLTLTMAKAMVPVAGRPLIGHTLSWLKEHGIVQVGINLHYLGRTIADYVGDGSHFGLNVVYSHEDSLLGTAGGTKRLASLFEGSRFAVVYGDVLTHFDLDAMVRFHVDAGALATIAVSAVPNPHEKGVVQIDESGRIVDFVEKPPRGTEKGNLANAGIYIVDPEILSYISPLGSIDFGLDVFPLLLRSGRRLYGYKLKESDYLMDIGSMDNYRQANDDYAAGKVGTNV